MDLLRGMEPREPLQLSDDLCVYSINILNRESSLLIPLASQPSGVKSEMIGTQKAELHSPRSLKSALKAQQKTLTQKYKKVKQMTIDYYCREDLTITTLKEFFEIFISSLKKDQAFH